MECSICGNGLRWSDQVIPICICKECMEKQRNGTLREEIASSKAALELERKKVEELRRALEALLRRYGMHSNGDIKLACDALSKALSHSEPTSEKEGI